jgi:TM2 domain-containing membrane protein YozV
MMVAPKNPAVSLIVSFFIPGVGSMINGDVGTGVAILLLYIIGWFTVLIFVGVPLALGAWIWGMVDAYKGAQRWNARHGIIS